MTAARTTISVLDVIESRAATGSKPGERTDPWIVGLAIEGGAMRGVVSAGMGVGFEQLGLVHTVDRVFGSSVGSINGAYLISGQAAMCVGSYYNEMTSREFIDFTRPLRRGPILSLSFVLDVSAEKTRPLDWTSVLESPIELHPIATSLDTFEWEDLGTDGFENKSDLKEALRASSQYPVIAGPPALFRGREYLDATVTMSIPFQAALDAGCTHVLVLRTRPAGEIRPIPSSLDRHFIAPRLRKTDARLPSLYLSRNETYKRELDALDELTAQDVACSILPSQALPTLSAFDRNRERTMEAGREGVRSVYRVFEDREPLVVDVLRAY